MVNTIFSFILTHHLEESDLSITSREAIASLKGTFLSNNHQITIGFDHLSAPEILRQLLPAGLDAPSSFECAGHLAHVNLREEFLPYKDIIGQVILAKNPHIQVVVNKLGAIDTTFRHFSFEVIARRNNACENNLEAETIVEVQESNCRFRFDYAHVYWNSRLQAEHWRLVKEFQKEQSVCDLFCGVGPFAIPAAKHRHCLVYANDLNPESVRWLQENQQRNRIDSNRLKIFNEDARAFLRTALRLYPSGFDHYVMNLPASAHEFLDIFAQVASDGTMPLKNPPALIHCYVFCKGDEQPLDKIEMGLGHSIDRANATVRRVRDVAPNKEMFCVSFSLPLDLFCKQKEGNIDKHKIEKSHQSKIPKIE